MSDEHITREDSLEGSDGHQASPSPNSKPESIADDSPSVLHSDASQPIQTTPEQPSEGETIAPTADLPAPLTPTAEHKEPEEESSEESVVQETPPTPDITLSQSLSTAAVSDTATVLDDTAQIKADIPASDPENAAETTKDDANTAIPSSVDIPSTLPVVERDHEVEAVTPASPVVSSNLLRDDFQNDPLQDQPNVAESTQTESQEEPASGVDHSLEPGIDSSNTSPVVQDYEGTSAVLPALPDSVVDTSVAEQLVTLGESVETTSSTPNISDESQSGPLQNELNIAESSQTEPQEELPSSDDHTLASRDAPPIVSQDHDDTPTALPALPDPVVDSSVTEQQVISDENAETTSSTPKVLDESHNDPLLNDSNVAESTQAESQEEPATVDHTLEPAIGSSDTSSTVQDDDDDTSTTLLAPPAPEIDNSVTEQQVVLEENAEVTPSIPKISDEVEGRETEGAHYDSFDPVTLSASTDNNPIDETSDLTPADAVLPETSETSAVDSMPSTVEVLERDQEVEHASTNLPDYSDPDDTPDTQNAPVADENTELEVGVPPLTRQVAQPVPVITRDYLAEDFSKTLVDAGDLSGAASPAPSDSQQAMGTEDEAPTPLGLATPHEAEFSDDESTPEPNLTAPRESSETGVDPALIPLPPPSDEELPELNPIQSCHTETPPLPAAELQPTIALLQHTETDLPPANPTNDPADPSSATDTQIEGIEINATSQAELTQSDITPVDLVTEQSLIPHHPTSDPEPPIIDLIPDPSAGAVKEEPMSGPTTPESSRVALAGPSTHEDEGIPYPISSQAPPGAETAEEQEQDQSDPLTGDTTLNTETDSATPSTTTELTEPDKLEHPDTVSKLQPTPAVVVIPSELPTTTPTLAGDDTPTPGTPALIDDTETPSPITPQDTKNPVAASIVKQRRPALHIKAQRSVASSASTLPLPIPGGWSGSPVIATASVTPSTVLAVAEISTPSRQRYDPSPSLVSPRSEEQCVIQ